MPTTRIWNAFQIEAEPSKKDVARFANLTGSSEEVVSILFILSSVVPSRGSEAFLSLTHYHTPHRQVASNKVLVASFDNG